MKKMNLRILSALLCVVMLLSGMPVLADETPPEASAAEAAPVEIAGDASDAENPGGASGETSGEASVEASGEAPEEAPGEASPEAPAEAPAEEGGEAPAEEPAANPDA